MRCSLFEQFFGNAIGGEIGTQTQQLGCRRMRLLDLLKGERPGGGDRIGIVTGLLSPPGQQSCTMLLIELEVVPKATSGFFDIRSCLIKCQGKAIEGNRHIRGLVALLIRGALVLRTMEQKADRKSVV